MEDLRNEYNHEYYIYNKDELVKQQNEYKQTEDGREAVKKANKNYRLKLLNKALDYYSNGKVVCNCCGDTNLEFLSLDGNASLTFLKKIQALDYPEGYEVLCMNCDWGILQNDGMCPHHLIEVKQ